jgi:hypothetical protein
MKIFLEICKINFKKILLFFINHKSNKIGINNKNIQFADFTIIDLNKNLQSNKNIANLYSYEFESGVASSKEYPCIESWVEVQNNSYSVNNIFLYEQYKKIRSSKNKKKLSINENIYLLPYYTSHFGHFAGDLLGQILYYVNFMPEINNQNKLFVITPSKEWDDFLIKFSKNNIAIYKPNAILESNYLFKNSIILPRISSVQNYLLAKNILSTKIKKNKNSPKKVFLTSEREDRISNIYELKKKLEDSGFILVNPKNFKVLDLLTIIKSADILISEKASILNNVHLVRDEKYYLLSSITEKILNKKLFYGAGIYKEFHRGLFEEIYCEDDPTNQDVRAFKKRIKVDVNSLLPQVKYPYQQ